MNSVFLTEAHINGSLPLRSNWIIILFNFSDELPILIKLRRPISPRVIYYGINVYIAAKL